MLFGGVPSNRGEVFLPIEAWIDNESALLS